MKTRDIIAAVLFLLGMFLDLGGMATLLYLDSKSVIWSAECGRVTAVVIIGLVMQTASIAMDFIPKRKDNKSDR